MESYVGRESYDMYTCVVFGIKPHLLVFAANSIIVDLRLNFFFTNLLVIIR